jgi:hypothetical protein
MHLGFHCATVYQERNQHDLMKDFEDEIECFLNTRKVIDVLNSIKPTGILLEDLGNVYSELHSNKIINTKELSLIEAWQKDFTQLSQ